MDSTPAPSLSPSPSPSPSPVAAPRRRSRAWPLAFLALNALGLAAVVWRIEAGRRPPGVMTVVRHSPAGEVAAETVTEVTVEMGTVLAPDTVRADSLRLIPAAAGATELRGGRRLVFVPQAPLAEATPYEVRLDGRLRGAAGELPPDEALRFSTRRLRVLGIAQAALSPEGECALEFSFSSPVNPAQLRAHLAVTSAAGRGSPVEFDMAGAGAGARLRALCRGVVPGDELLVKVSAGLTGTAGPLGTAEAHSAKVPTSVRLAVVGVDADFDEDSPTVRVRTSHPVDPGAAAGLVAVSPPAGFRVEAAPGGFELRGDFQSGRRYELTVRGGLAGQGSLPLGADFVRSVWFPDRPGRVRFGARGGYLSPLGALKVPVLSTNVGRFTLRSERLYAGNVVEHVLRPGHYWFGPMTGLARELDAREFAVTGERNREVETLVDVAALGGGEEARGVYGLSLESREGRYWDRPTTTVTVSDLGAAARLWPGRALVWALRLSSAEPAGDVSVSVWSDRRQLLGRGVTDARGLAEVKLAETPAGEGPAVAVLEAGRDLTWLRLRDRARPRGEASAGGRLPAAGAYEAHAFTDRGAYRAGDEVRLAAFLRDRDLAAPPEMPLRLVVRRGDRRELLARTVRADRTGRLTASFELPGSAPEGLYRAELLLPGSDTPLGTATFTVADYVPRTLRLKLAGPEGRHAALAGPIEVRAAAEHLFGGPAGGLAAVCRWRYLPADFRPKGWDGYAFGDARRRSRPGDWHEREAQLDPAGLAAFRLEPEAPEAPAALSARVFVEVREPGGRAVTESLEVPVDPWKAYLGLRPPAASPAAGSAASFGLAAVAPDGSAAPGERACTARLYRVTWSYVLRRSEGRGAYLEYEWKRHENHAGEQRLALRDGRAELSLTPDAAGPHRLVVESDGACAAALDFHVSGPGAQWAMEDPESLELRLDRPSYQPGEKARLTVRSPFGGTVLLCAERDRVIEARTAELPGGQAEFEFDVEESWRPNVFLTATVVRPVRPDDEWKPHRASGSALLRVDCADRRLTLELAAPAEARPGGKLEVEVRAARQGRPAAGAAVVLAAVDEGVLALTGFRTPDPLEFFHGPRRLTVQDFDMYSDLAADLARWKLAGPAAPGGSADDADALGDALARRLNPVAAKRVRTAVLWAGGLTTGEDGAARAAFTLPEFVGELRLMAFAADGGAFASAERPLKVRSPLMAQASWPRFLAPGDEFELPVTVINRTGAAGRAELALELAGPLETAGAPPPPVEVPDGGETTVRLRLRAGGVGKAEARLRARLGAESFSTSVELPVRPACPLVRRSGAGVVEAGQERELVIAPDLLPAGARCSLVAAGSPLVELSGALDGLLQYPYGCLEQTVSRLVPLVYLRDLAAARDPGSVGAEEVARLLEAGFLRLQTMQTPGGGLGMWPGSNSPYDWGSVYAADVLLEARKAGHDVPAALLDPLLGYLRESLERWTGGDAGSRGTAAYACCVLARGGRPAHTWMSRLEERFAAENAPVTARFHLAAAALAAGDAAAARKAVAGLAPVAAVRQTGGYLDSPVREAAVMLAVLLDVDREAPLIPRLAERLRKELRLGRWGTTQENAFALMALGKLARASGAAGEFTGSARLPDGRTLAFDSRKGLSVADLAPGAKVTVRIEGRGKAWVWWQAEGLPADGQPREADSGLALRREFLEADGRPVPPDGLVQGRLYRVRLTLRAARSVENLVISDLLPAGLEIENPRLRSAAAAAGGEAAQEMAVRHVERRDDRVLVFADPQAGDSSFSYVVRAVSAGRFALPATDCSCMYDPDIYSTHGAGRVKVKAQ